MSTKIMGYGNQHFIREHSTITLSLLYCVGRGLDRVKNMGAGEPE